MGGRQRTSIFLTKEKATERLAREREEKAKKAKGKKKRR
jgi:hypothetical protein